jgi:hypothetical protein
MSTGPQGRPDAGESHRPTTLLVVLGVVLVGALVAAAVVVFVVGGGGDDRDSTLAGKPAKPSASVHVQFEPTSVVSQNGGPPAQLSLDQVNAIMDAAGKYLDLAVIEPLKTGKPAPDVSGLFDPAAAAQLNGLGRGALFEEGLPAATGDITAIAPVVEVTGLSDGSGTFVLATVGSTVDIVAETDDGEVTIHRVTDLTLVPDGAGWKISGFKIQVDRQGAGVTQPATSTQAGQ